MSTLYGREGGPRACRACCAPVRPPRSPAPQHAHRARGARSWLEWSDKRGKLRLMCGAYALEDGRSLAYYHIGPGSVIHPLCTPPAARPLKHAR